ncbi:translation elongation factor Ts [bacterium]|nr:translation elongation factor Ts [bacterium]
MTTISAKMVSELREKTGAGMMKCKEALSVCQGNFEEAIDYLRKKGMASADSKSSRTTSQGLVVTAVSQDGSCAAMLELNCETDFVARTDDFKHFSRDLVECVLNNPDVSNVPNLETMRLPSNHTVEEERKALISKIGENVTINRFELFKIPLGKYGVFDTYIHGDGNLGVVTLAECTSARGAIHDDLRQFAHDVSLQVAAMKPKCINRGDISSEVLNREKEILRGQLKEDPKNANKPEEILRKIIDGRLDKFFIESCLMDQAFIKDDTKNIATVADELEQKLGGRVSVSLFRRWVVGEKASPTSA